MSNSIVLTHAGLFAGASVDEKDLFDLKDPDGNVCLRDGQVVRGVPIAALTPLFLDTFPPTEGWAVLTDHQPGCFNLPDPYTVDGHGKPIPQPTEWITVRLLDPQGRVVAQATSLVIINGPKAYERGETIARGRLYEALGLPRSTAPVVEDLPTAGKTPAATTATATTASTQPSATASGLQAAVKALPSGKRPTDVAPVAPREVAPTPPGPSAEQEAADDGNTQASPNDPPKRSTLKVIERQAKVRCVSVPSFRTEQEAAAFLRQLRAGGLN